MNFLLAIKSIRIFSLLVFGIVISVTNSCRMPESLGFYQPITMSLKAPDGPPEYKAGWHAGCSTGLGNKSFANSFVYQQNSGPDYGNGVYQHDPVFQMAWGQGFFACVAHSSTFTDFNSMKYGPLQ